MIHFVTTRFGRHTIHEALATAFWEHRQRFRPWTYEELLDRHAADHAWTPPDGLWVWTDHERLDPDLLDQATVISQRMAKSEEIALGARRGRLDRRRFPQGRAERFGQLNRPDVVLTRYDLQKALFAAGVNDFRVFRTDELPTDLRFPVFLRLADDHRGPRSELIHDAATLASEVAALPEAPMIGTRRNQRYGQDWLVVEYIDVRSEDGLFRKYSAMIAGAEPFPRHLYTHSDWMIKFDAGDRRPEVRAAERRFLGRDPHAQELRSVFAQSGINFGRVDYSVLPDGRIQVWEINTNPSILMYAVADDPHRVAVNNAGARRTLDGLIRMESRVRRHQSGPPVASEVERYTLALRAARPGDPRPPALTGANAPATPEAWERERATLDQSLRRTLPR